MPSDLPRGNRSNEPPTVPSDKELLAALLDGEYLRFSQETEDILLVAGWCPGRDASGRVDPWVADFSATDGKYGLRHEVFPAAERVLDEFGFLDVESHSWPENWLQEPVHFYPMDVWTEPSKNVKLSRQLGLRVCPIAQTYGPAQDILIDERGAIYRHDGYDTWYRLGDTIDEALELIVHEREPVALDFRDLFGRSWYRE